MCFVKDVHAVMNNEKKSIIGVGIDQGIANCGYSIVKLHEDDSLSLLKSGSIVTSSNMPLPDRIALLYRLLIGLVDVYQPSVIGCEKLFFNPKQKQLNYSRNKSASIVSTNMATGILYLIAGQKQISLYEFVPTTIKKYVTGSGKATKEDVESAMLNIFPHQLNIKNSHEADAIAIGVTAVKYYKDLLQNIKEEERSV